MRPEKPITARQLRRLQTLWGLLARQEGFDPKDRNARLNWVAVSCQLSAISSFKELSEAEAAKAIDAIQKLLPPEVIHRRGRRGRRGKKKPGSIAIERARNAPSAASLELIQTLLGELSVATGETRDLAWLERWLATGRSAPARRLATQRDADRIIPALRAMARRAKPSAISIQPSAPEVHA